METEVSPAPTGRKPMEKHTRVLLILAAMIASNAINEQFGLVGGPIIDFLNRWIDNVALAGASVLILMRAFTFKKERLAWALIGSSLAVWTLGNIYYSAVLFDMSVIPIPSFADLCWILLYPPCYVAIVLLVKERFHGFDRAMWLDGLIGALGIAALGAAVILQAVLDSTGGSTLSVATNLAYPLGDVLLMALIVGIIAVAGWNVGRGWIYLATGFLVFAMVDSIYLFGTAQGWWIPGNVFEGGWPIAFLLLAAGAWQTEGSERRQLDGKLIVVLPSCFGLLGLGVLVYDHFVRVNGLALVLSSACIIAMLARLFVTIKGGKSLLAASEIDARTDSLTGLGNRRRLTQELGELLDELEGSDRTFLLVIYDLDGFKSYNDRFGHVAGDALLSRLGTRLGDAVGKSGIAYRMGGDEFCVLAEVKDEGVHNLLSKTAAALSEVGEGFEITSSYGCAFLPVEALDISHALRTADERLYAQKHRNRTSASRQSADVLLKVLGERHPDLTNHLNDVASLAEAVAIEMKLGEVEIDQIRRGAELHDVGKVAIPDRILQKPGPLTDEEWMFMRQHTIVGERILSAAPSLARVAKIVRSSHERFDGRGYPDGLATEDVPLGARIIFVCDAYDAMTTERPYNQALTADEATLELRRCAGTQFDPEVVEAFVSVISRREGSPDGPLTWLSKLATE